MAVEAGQEGQADRAVEIGEQAEGAGEGRGQVRAQLVAQCDAVGDQVASGTDGGPQGGCGRAVGRQGTKPGTIGTQGIGQHVRVEPVVFVADGAVPAAQVLDLVGLITTTVSPAASRASTTGPSPRSMATSAAPALLRRWVRSFNPASVWLRVKRVVTVPAVSTTQTA
ncbi:hypothetical protein HNR40_007393 [Nonomuraea endophytica]|uniref:Uncharacterized protein n=1 Tax=Nonomuraea endophytica TaxID=714136 RepID=A0A7W8A964_9ACTN|nr:hypothetical protein [Nonomuraea endophytica]